MPYPTVHDDGATVTLDLHGATVDDAIRLARQAVREAARRGRRAVKLVHGTSTSERRLPGRTIKQALYDALDGRDFGNAVTGALRYDATLTLSLDLSASSDPRPIRLRDLLP